MDEYLLAKESGALIKKDFQLEDNLNISEKDPFNELKDQLITILSYLINKDMNRLLTALYRIDVSEHKVNAILTQSHPDEIAIDLADAIIERERLKAQYRMKYRDS